MSRNTISMETVGVFEIAHRIQRIVYYLNQRIDFFPIHGNIPAVLITYRVPIKCRAYQLYRMGKVERREIRRTGNVAGHVTMVEFFIAEAGSFISENECDLSALGRGRAVGQFFGKQAEPFRFTPRLRVIPAERTESEKRLFEDCLQHALHQRFPGRE